MDKIKILALFGESGAGKDTIQRWIVSNIPGTKGIVSCTTRPKRDYEIDGKDYHFISNEKFAEKVLDGTMLEATSFNGWHYGTSLEELSETDINIGVFNIQGIECLLEDPRIHVEPVYILVRDKERLIRILNREEEPNCLEVCRRFQTDYQDFADIPFDYKGILNNGVPIHGDKKKQDQARALLTLFG